MQNQAAVIAVDWGTSHLRMWPLDPSGKALDCRKSADGMRTVAKSDFASVMNGHLKALGLPDDVPAIMCGMVGSRQGWQEAPYVTVPCHIGDPALGAVKINNTSRDMRIMPGIANRSLDKADVMRSEETQLLGLKERMGNALTGLVCMPGTHAKWVHVEDERVLDFFTALSGELFAALGAGSVLKHALDGASGPVDANGTAFVDVVQQSLDEPATILNRLFSVRPKSLLHDLNNNDAAAFISGTIIGQDIAGAKARFGDASSVILVGSGHLGTLYASALNIAGLPSQMVDGDELAVAGLAHAARLIWPDRFNLK